MLLINPILHIIAGIEPYNAMYKSFTQKFFLEAYGIVSFTLRFFKELVTPPYEITESVMQSYSIGFKSFPLITITSFVIGLVLILQSRPSLVEFGAGSYIPAMAAASIVREIGPMITGLVCAGNIGSSITAELGSMKVTEQIDAMEVSGTNPFKFLVVTRMIGTTLVIPILVIHADVISLMGSYFGANIKDNISFKLFFAEVFEKLTFKDVIPAFIKSYFFGFAIGLVACYKGFTSENGTEGVGKAANASVIIAMVFVILIDMVVTQIGSIFNLL
ncbi:MAG: MlaE family ABC transporter permease [Bacteroidia bacterium]